MSLRCHLLGRVVHSMLPQPLRVRHKDLNLGYAIRYYLKTLAGVGGAVLSYMFCSKALHLYKLTT